MTVAAVTSRSARRPAIDRVNPVTKLLASALIAIALVLSLDSVSAAVALGAELALLPFAGLRGRSLLLRLSPVLVAAPLSAVTVLLYGRPSGETHLSFLLVQVTDGSIALAVASLLRVLAIGIPAVVLFATVDPTDLADSLAQVLRLPARFVVGALAGLRLMGLLGDDWRALTLSRRARGIGDAGRVRAAVGASFALLVLAIRRGTRLATAMEARGFGGPGARTWARPSLLGRADALLLGVTVAVVGAAVTAAVASGAWNFVGAV